ncbi:MAG: hypothetical protein ONB48_16765 [candidate division KSB1 bacterium]|nr:hypothetical protein [candidate division KSB1 bacterium]MDZ7275131.1 hypothetical protein [candidate division KSB1 bacterium]MDZ7287301.1 hypothetical protein [candidate division KSB1 bacterium]MDZ7299415.1 hypothetical protein [candidate division KSB1 bacterium]MDZ7308054.1 hypothetical protein [candidate division KSB1 bacterium]
MNENGEFLWPAAIPMSVGIWGVLTSDNSGGFFWTAHEQIAYRPTNGRIFRTRVFRYDGAGANIWPTTGIAITDSVYEQTFSPEVLVNDHQDVAIIYRALSGAFDNIYVQRINF